MKKTASLFLLCLLAASVVSGQKFSKDYWHNGEVDLASGETVNGKIRYNLDDDQIQVLIQNTVKSYTPQRVKAFQFVDELEGVNRYFFSLPFQDQENYTRYQFFELLSEGPVSLLSREKVVERIQTHMDPFWVGGMNMRVVYLMDNYYLMNENGDIRSCDAKVDALMRFMEDQKENVRNFVKSNKLNLEDRADMIRAVDFYNSVKYQN